MNWLRQHLADDWQKLVRLPSVILHLIAIAVAATYAAMPVLDPSIAGILPAPLQAKAIGLYATVGLIVRITKLKADG